MSALTADRRAKCFGSPIRATLVGFVAMIGSLMLALSDMSMLTIHVFVMFVIHTLAASEVNHNARSLLLITAYMFSAITPVMHLVFSVCMTSVGGTLC